MLNYFSFVLNLIMNVLFKLQLLVMMYKCNILKYYQKFFWVEFYFNEDFKVEF